MMETNVMSKLMHLNSHSVRVCIAKGTQLSRQICPSCGPSPTDFIRENDHYLRKRIDVNRRTEKNLGFGFYPVDSIAASHTFHILGDRNLHDTVHNERISCSRYIVQLSS